MRGGLAHVSTTCESAPFRPQLSIRDPQVTPNHLQCLQAPQSIGRWHKQRDVEAARPAGCIVHQATGHDEYEEPVSSRHHSLQYPPLRQAQVPAYIKHSTDSKTPEPPWQCALCELRHPPPPPPPFPRAGMLA